MTTIPFVANEGGKYGEVIKAVLRDRPDLSYSKLAEMFAAANVRDPKSGRLLNKSRIFSYADDQTNTPDWFMKEFGKVVMDDPDWWNRSQSDMSRSRGAAMRKRKLPLLRSNSGDKAGETVEVFGAPSGGAITAVLVEDDTHRPQYVATDLVLIDTDATKPTEMRVYASLEKEGREAVVVLRRATWDDERDKLVLKAPKGRRKDLDASDADVLGMVVVKIDRFQPNHMPRGTFDYDGYLFGEDW